jgi:hypothetical protein
VSLEGLQASIRVPRIDVYDISRGAGLPAFALSPAINTLGTEYLFMCLGAGVGGRELQAAITCLLGGVNLLLAGGRDPFRTD